MGLLTKLKQFYLMNNKQYLAQNALGFEGDTFLKEWFEKITTENKITWIVETGTFRGATTRHFANMAAKVDTIEINAENFAAAKETLAGVENVNMHFGNSAEVLKAIFDARPKQGKKPNTLFFLDAHWGEYNPLLDELALIKEYGFKPVIAIHDFKVPGNAELGFDTYGSILYEWDYIKDAIEAIYGEGKYLVEYNSQATGAKRGVIVILPA